MDGQQNIKKISIIINLRKFEYHYFKSTGQWRNRHNVRNHKNVFYDAMSCSM